MKALVVYYSRTGVTRIVAETIRAILQCDCEELLDTQSRRGLFGYFRSGKQAMRKELTTLKPTKYDPSQYDVVIVGTPVWVYDIATPVRTWLEQNKDKVKNLAVFCTHGGKDFVSTPFQEMEGICGLMAVAKLNVRTRDVKRAEHVLPVNEFVKKLMSGSRG